jgi:tetratricopeptide (TPR) repeat protein
LRVKPVAVIAADFFVSRAGADAGAAELIADIIRDAGLEPFYQNEHFGHADFMRRMEQGCESGVRMIALLSPEYQQSEYCRAEYNHVLGKDPANFNERLVVLRVAPCDPVGSLQNLPYTDLVPVMSDRAALASVVRAAIGVDRHARDLKSWQPLRRAGQQIRHPEIRAFKSFTGRSDLLEGLDRKLWDGRCAVAIRNSGETTVALRGLGGVGKTVLAQEYAWRRRDRYHGIWWIRAGLSETLTDDLVALGKRLIPGLEDIELYEAAQRTVDYLAQVQTPKRWLLVYDNVDDPAAIRRLTPADNAHVLITTRRTDWNGEADELPVDVFDRDAAVAFLMMQARQNDQAAAGRLADALDRLPLALSHARAYCWSRNWSFDQYVAQLPEVINKAPKAAAYPASVFATFSLAIDNAAKDCPEAQTLMELLAFFAPDQVPLWLIPGDTLPQPALGDVVEALGTVSLVGAETLPNGEPAISVHRMVQEVTRARLRAAGRFDEAAGKATRATFAAYDYSGSFAAAERHGYWLSHGLAVVVHAPRTGAEAWHSLWVWIRIGEIRLSRGESRTALDSYRAALAIAARLAAADPGNADWQRDVAASHSRIGDALVAQGNLPAALESYRAALAFSERLATADSGNAGSQRDLSISQSKIGDVLVAQGNLAAALDSYEASLAISERLAKAAPGNAGSQRDLNWALFRVADVQISQGNLAAALTDLRRVHESRERLAAADPGNADCQSDLSMSHSKIGDVLVAQGNFTAALDSYEASLAISERLAKADPGNAGWQRDLSVSQSKIGDVLVAQRNLAAALDSYEASLAISERLAKADPGNARWQRDLSVSQSKIGDVLVAQRNLAAALDSYEASLAISERLAPSLPVVRWLLRPEIPASEREITGKAPRPEPGRL